MKDKTQVTINVSIRIDSNDFYIDESVIDILLNNPENGYHLDNVMEQFGNMTLRELFLPAINKPRGERQKALSRKSVDSERSISVNKIPIDEMGFSFRIYRIFKSNNINTSDDIIRLGENAIKNLKGLGKTSFKEFLNTMRVLKINVPIDGE